MAGKTSSNVATIPAAPTLASTYSGAEWAKLAEMLVRQDIVLLPTLTQTLGHEDVDTASENRHRKASALALAEHWQSMGFALTKADALRLCDEDTTVHAWLHKHITPALKTRLGGHVRMTPMYPNFPKQVMDMDEAELLHNALMHYLGDELGVRIVPHSDVDKRKPLKTGEGQVRALRVIDQAQLQEDLTKLVQMNTVWTPAQNVLAKQALPLMVAWKIVGDHTSLLQRENQAHLMGAWLDLVRTGKTPANAWPAERVSATDLLRAAVAYSGGDPSLASSSEKVRFAKLSRPQRRVIMQALERAVGETSNPLNDLHLHRQSWLRLGERLHVGEWTKMPKAVKAVNDLRNLPAPISWAGKLDALLGSAPTQITLAQVLALFPENPGYAARALGRVMLWADKNAADVAQAFYEIADRVDTPLLLALGASFEADAAKPKRARVMIPKGMAAKRYRVEAKGKALSPEACFLVSRACDNTLTARFAQLPPLGKVFVEPGLNDVIVPKGLRSASDSVGVVARGSWLPVGKDAEIVRLFLWWKDTDDGRVDVDLSAVGVSKDFGHTETCNYHAMQEQGMTHSGDFTSAPSGAAEFVDIRLDKLNKHTRYIVLGANVFHGPGFSQLPECFVGWQERESGKGQRGEVMELKTVVDKFQVTASTKGFLGVVFDVKERRLMWLDLPMNAQSGNSIHGSMDNVLSVVEDFQTYAFAQPKIGHLINLHIQARGGVEVEDAKDADVVFSLTTKMAKKGQTVIAATQPMQVASELLTGPKRVVAAPAAVKQVEVQENELDVINGKVRKETKVRRSKP